MSETVAQLVAAQARNMDTPREVRDAWNIILQHGEGLGSFLRNDSGHLTLTRRLDQLNAQPENVRNAVDMLVRRDALRALATSPDAQMQVTLRRLRTIRATAHERSQGKGGTEREQAERTVNGVAATQWQMILNYAQMPGSDVSFLSVGAGQRININPDHQVVTQAIRAETTLGNAFQILNGSNLTSRLIDGVSDELLPTYQRPPARPREEGRRPDFSQYTLVSNDSDVESATTASPNVPRNMPKGQVQI